MCYTCFEWLFCPRKTAAQKRAEEQREAERLTRDTSGNFIAPLPTAPLPPQIRGRKQKKKKTIVSFMENKVAGNRLKMTAAPARGAFAPGGTRGGLVNKVIGLTFIETVTYGNHAPDSVLQVFQVPVPSAHEGKHIGPTSEVGEGIELRKNYGMQALAIEFASGSIDFDISKDTVLEAGNFLWFGFETDLELPDDEARAARSLSCLKDFLGREQEANVDDVLRSGSMPLMQKPIPSSWYGKTLIEVDARKCHGITIAALEQKLDGSKKTSTIYFPNPVQTKFKQGDIAYVSILSVRSLEALIKEAGTSKLSS